MTRFEFVVRFNCSHKNADFRKVATLPTLAEAEVQIKKSSPKPTNAYKQHKNA